MDLLHKKAVHIDNLVLDIVGVEPRGPRIEILPLDPLEGDGALSQIICLIQHREVVIEILDFAQESEGHNTDVQFAGKEQKICCQ